MNIFDRVTFMTKETSNPDSLENQIADAPAGTTVFSDGSTFNYEEGYKSNGAPVATRDRTDAPTIVKSYKVITAERVLFVVASLIVIFLLAMAVGSGIASVQKAENWKALKAGVNDSGQVEVVQSVAPSNLIVKRPDGSMFKCDASLVSNNGNPVGLVFCAPGGKDTFSIPLPHDPQNIFYVAPAKDSEKK